MKDKKWISKNHFQKNHTKKAISPDTISLYKNKCKRYTYKKKYSTWLEKSFFYIISIENIIWQCSWPSVWLLSYCSGNDWLCSYSDLAPSQTNFMRQDTFVVSLHKVITEWHRLIVNQVSIIIMGNSIVNRMK